jgi:Zn-dependent protease with chaperone function
MRGGVNGRDMKGFDGPEVIRRERDARRKRRLLKWGIFIVYAFIWLVIIISAVVKYYTGSGIGKLEHVFFHDLKDLIILSLMLLPALMLLIVAALIGLNPMRGLNPLPYMEANAAPAVRRLRSAIEAVSIASGRPPLACLVMPSSMPNALGVIIKGESYLVVTSGLLEADLPERELTAVVAHEAAHIATGDALTLKSSIRFYLTSMFCMLVTIVLFILTGMKAVLAPLFIFIAIIPTALGIYLDKVINRQDDLFADALAVEITRDPDALISAIMRIATSEGVVDYSSFETMFTGPYGNRVPASLPIFTSGYFFVNPFHRQEDKPTQEQQAMSRQTSTSDDETLGPITSQQSEVMFSWHHGPEKNFIIERLTTLEHIKKGHVITTGQATKVPADEWE